MGDAGEIAKFYIKKMIRKGIMSLLKNPYTWITIGGIILVVFIVFAVIGLADSGSIEGLGGLTPVTGDTKSIGAVYLQSWENPQIEQYKRGLITTSKYIDGEYYICYTDYAIDRGDRNFSTGICHRGTDGTYYHVASYSNQGIAINSGAYDTVGVSKIEVTKVDAVFEEIYQGARDDVVNSRI